MHYTGAISLQMVLTVDDSNITEIQHVMMDKGSLPEWIGAT